MESLKAFFDRWRGHPQQFVRDSIIDDVNSQSPGGNLPVCPKAAELLKLAEFLSMTEKEFKGLPNFCAQVIGIDRIKTDDDEGERLVRENHALVHDPYPFCMYLDIVLVRLKDIYDVRDPRSMVNVHLTHQNIGEFMKEANDLQKELQYSAQQKELATASREWQEKNMGFVQTDKPLEAAQIIRQLLWATLGLGQPDDDESLWRFFKRGVTAPIPGCPNAPRPLVQYGRQRQ